MIRLLSAALIFLTAHAASGPAAELAELFMYRSPGCPYCAAWDRAIGSIYPKTDAGKRAPLRHAEVGSSNLPKIELKSPVRFTPTFVLVRNGRELGRIEGYPGEDFFWGLLERLMLQHQF